MLRFGESSRLHRLAVEAGAAEATQPTTTGDANSPSLSAVADDESPMNSSASTSTKLDQTKRCISTPYKPPTWGGLPTHPFTLEVIKNGAEIGSVELSSRDHFVVGKQDGLCHIVLEHPSISRQHAVIQHRAGSGVYLYDLGSTNGSTVNKRRVPAREYTELSVGDVLRFGDSKRLLCLHGPDELRKEVLRDRVRVQCSLRCLLRCY